MFDFFARWIFRRRDAAAREAEAASKAWLDDLRRNELSLNARRRLAPEEPVTAPAIAHGSAQAVTDVDRIVAGFSQQAAAKNTSKADHGEEGGVSAAGDTDSAGAAGETSGESGGGFGGGGSDGSFGGAESGGASGESGGTS